MEDQVRNCCKYH